MTGDLIVDVVWILFITDDLTLTRPVQILRQRQVQTDNNGLRWVNPPGFGNFILLTPNSVIILNGPQKRTWIQCVLVYCDFHLHPKSPRLCVGQCPRYRWSHTPCGRRAGRGEWWRCRGRFYFKARLRKEKLLWPDGDRRVWEQSPDRLNVSFQLGVVTQVGGAVLKRRQTQIHSPYGLYSSAPRDVEWLSHSFT